MRVHLFELVLPSEAPLGTSRRTCCLPCLQPNVSIFSVISPLLQVPEGYTGHNDIFRCIVLADMSVVIGVWDWDMNPMDDDELVGEFPLPCTGHYAWVSQIFPVTPFTPLCLRFFIPGRHICHIAA